MSLKDKLPGYNGVVLPYHFIKTGLVGAINRWPGKKMRVIGVTGTNGKTTTCFMIWKMLTDAGYKTGLITTVAWGVDEIHNQIEHMTTPDVRTLNKRMKECYKAGAEFLVLEVTSHALAQFRTMGIPIEIAVMTNVTHEHLDYHKTFERYVKAKTKLFKGAKYGVINIDDPSWIEFRRAIAGADEEGSKKYVTYGIDERCDLQAVKVKLSAEGVHYKAKGDAHGTVDIKTQIPGKFNVYNSLAAAAVGLKLGLKPEQISRGIYALESVEGRMNRLDFGQDYGVIVDFAHTPDAFQKVYDSVYPHEGGRIISLFGGAGRRDESTRAERGEIAGKYSDLVIITEDDSRDEDPKKIAEMFVEGVKKAGLSDKEIIIELDREKAIRRAIKEARKGDLVLILGKGHEKTILRADGPHEFEDLKVTEKAIKARQK